MNYKKVVNELVKSAVRRTQTPEERRRRAEIIQREIDNMYDIDTPRTLYKPS